MIARFAEFYVNYLEPALFIIILASIVITLLYVINLFRDPKKKTEFINGAFHLIVKIVKGFLGFTGKLLLWSSRVLLKTITVIYASIRDFFTSKI